MHTLQALFQQAVAAHQRGRLDEAATLYQRVLTVDPNHPDAMHLLGMIRCRQPGQSAIGIELIRKGIALRPNVAAYHETLGIALANTGDYAGAITSYNTALKLDDKPPEIWFNLANAQRASGRYDDAIAAYDRAIALRPVFLLAAINNRAVTMHESGQPQKAIAEYKTALKTYPTSVELWKNLGNAQHALSLHTEAADSYRHAVALLPDDHAAWRELATMLTALDEPDTAISAAQRAVSLKPDNAIAYQNLGFALRKAGRLDEAADAYRQAVAIDPSQGEAVANLAHCLRDVGLIEPAITLYRQAMTLTWASWPAESLIYALYFRPGETAESILEEHRQWNARYVKPITTRPVFANARDPDRRLRIGYVSPDFRNHVLAVFTAPLLANHDHTNVEVYCYNNSTIRDPITREIESNADVWREVAMLKDKELANVIRTDRIDVLIDITMHLDQNRLHMFAQRAAPVQACWIAYPGTTGLAEMDYRISDPYLDPPGNDAMSSEKTIRLPHTFWCYDPLTIEPAVNALPALANGYITFGCLNNFVKVTEQTLNAWAEVLLALPTSRLLVQVPVGQARNRISTSFERAGIDLSRIELLDRQNRINYLRLYNRFDLCIDTFPYNGHTTTFDSVWMGVPPLTAVGNTTVSRGGFSILSNLGLAEMCAGSLEMLPQKAIEIASDLPRLAELREELRERMRASPLMNARQFAGDIESAYRTMWREWCGIDQPVRRPHDWFATIFAPH